MFGQDQSTVFTRRELQERRDKPIEAVVPVVEEVPDWRTWFPVVGMAVVGIILWGVLRG